MEDRIGEIHITNEGYEIEIIEYFSAKNCTIQFKDSYIRHHIQYDKIKRGKIRNPNHRSILNVGFIGYGKYNPTTNFKEYCIWKRMLERCYNEKIQERQPTYKDVTVCEHWHNFQNFAEWFEQNYKENCVLDKDILIKSNKIYSHETCCFVPQEINNLFPKANSIRGEYPIGVSSIRNRFQVFCCINNRQKNIGLYNTLKEAFEAYKETKEKYIKEVADKWKDKIDPKVYEAMYKYEVEITD